MKPMRGQGTRPKSRSGCVGQSFQAESCSQPENGSAIITK